MKRLLPIFLLLASALAQNTYQPVFVGASAPMESPQLYGRRALWLNTADSSLSYCTAANVNQVCTSWQTVGSSGTVSADLSLNSLSVTTSVTAGSFIGNLT